MLCMAEADAFAQTSAQTPAQRPAQTSPQPAAASAGQAQTTGTAAPVDAARVVEFLDQTIAWYRQLAEQQRLVANANDDVYVSADRQLANEVVRLAFQFARTAASVQQTPGQGNATSAYQRSIQQEAEARIVGDRPVVREHQGQRFGLLHGSRHVTCTGILKLDIVL